MNLPEKIYSENDVAKAKDRAQVIGWAQGAGAVVAAGFAFKLLGWIPVLLVLGAVGWVLYKLFGGAKE